MEKRVLICFNVITTVVTILVLTHGVCQVPSICVNTSAHIPASDNKSPQLSVAGLLQALRRSNRFRSCRWFRHFLELKLCYSAGAEPPSMWIEVPVT